MIVYDKDVRPLEVTIPYEKFVEFIEAHGLDLTEEEREGLCQAEVDSKAKNQDAFVSMEEVKRELGCTE